MPRLNLLLPVVVIVVAVVCMHGFAKCTNARAQCRRELQLGVERFR